ncbi:vWA domain-containing protein [Halomonas ramblicola]|uniref:vWA domain-containing protein n=1 Tax=Halomonas ramblicola TaxID=747349 RepID=UPI0025B2CB0E|nr:vWA domain-containing protein [Halomonas ramblicola]MDN3522550.1 VWA domain-containing protein [Halomonas ramblicola]
MVNENSMKGGRRVACLMAGGLLVAGWSGGVAGSAVADAGGSFLIPELSASDGPITLDCNAGDWPADAMSFEVVSLNDASTVLGTGRMVIDHPDDLMQDESLYLFVELTDDTADNSDELVLMFDNSHDQVPPDTSSYEASDDRGIRFRRDGGAIRVFGTLDAPNDHPDPAEVDLEPGRLCIEGNTAGSPSWQIETELLPGDLGLNGFAALSGAAAVSADTSGGSDSVGIWPDAQIIGGTEGTTPQEEWSNLLTRQPIDYLLVLDQSGSMSGDKWESALQAGDNFALILSVLHDSEVSNEFGETERLFQGDRVGVTSFQWLSGSARTPTHIGLSSIPTNPEGLVSDALEDESPGGRTPMVAGINKAIGTYTAFGDAGDLDDPRQRVMLLLSDGKHNEPDTTIDFADFSYAPSPCGSETAIRINTVALGTDTTVDTGKLNAIKDCFSGNVGGDGSEVPLSIYNITGGEGATGAQLTAELTQFFVQTLEPYYDWNIINDNGEGFDLLAGERKLLLFAFWDNPGDAQEFTVTTPTGSETATADTDLGYAHLILDNPPEGTFGSFAPTADARMALVDLRVESRFGIDNRSHGTSSTITLRGRLREDGQPITGADVRVDIARPEEGFGSVASTLSPDRCEPHTPGLPPVDQLSGKALSALIEGRDTPVAVTDATDAGGGDVQPPAFSRMQAILDACGKPGLERGDDSGLRLFDDGTHGDEVADDGIYTLTYENTEIEGSYAFRFSATGAMGNGQPLHRVRQVAEYIRLDVDPAATTFDSRRLQEAENRVLTEHYVIPRDVHGGYLGPGHVDQVAFLVQGAQRVGPVRDYNNGIYSQVVRHDSGQPDPQVVPVVQDKPILPTPDGVMPAWALLIMILLVFIIIVLSILNWKRRQAGKP